MSCDVCRVMCVVCSVCCVLCVVCCVLWLLLLFLVVSVCVVRFGAVVLFGYGLVCLCVWGCGLLCALCWSLPGFLERQDRQN